jgi:uridine kinase
LRIVRSLLAEVRDDLVEMTDSVGALLQGRSLPRSREVTVLVGGEPRAVATGTPIRALLPESVGGALVVAGLLGQKPVSLSTPLFADASIAPLTVAHFEGRQIYTHSVGLMLLEAARRLTPELVVRLGPSRGPAQLVEVEGPADRADLARRLDGEMRRLVAADVAFRQEHWMLEEAMTLFRERDWEDAARLLRTRREGTAPLAALGEVYALSPGPILPSTGMARDFHLEVSGGDLYLDYGKSDPLRSGLVRAPPPRDTGMVEEHRAWLSGMGVSSVGAFNDLCISGQVSQLIRVAEGFHEKRIGRIADDAASRRDRLRIIAIAGPSSSGKTTFIKRLTVQLQINGLNPVGLSLDDYYVDREKTVRGPDGDYDFEAVEAIDLALLQDHVERLLAGEEIATARYDFRSGMSRPDGGPQIRLRPGDVLMLEGIHGLNPRLLGPIAEGQVYRVFIHPATTLAFDRLTRVSATDLRLLRRIVRDRHGRGYGAAATIERWPLVQKGEQTHIFPFQGEADAVFDSSLIYEPAVLKVYAERYLLEVPPQHAAYATAIRLRHLIDRFVSIYPDHVPPTSILREFVGESGFEY